MATKKQFYTEKASFITKKASNENKNGVETLHFQNQKK